MGFNNKKANIILAIFIVLNIAAYILIVYASYLAIEFVIIVCKQYLTGPAIHLLIKAVILSIVGGVLVDMSNKKIAKVKYYKRFSAALSTDPTHSIAHLAVIVYGDQDDVYINAVKIAIVELIEKGYFPKGTCIDLKNNCLIFPSESSGMPTNENITNNMLNSNAEYITVKCKGCGAETKMIKGSMVECEFCGSHL